VSRPPEKSTRGDWLVVLACLGCQVGMGAGAYVFPVFLKPVVDDLGWSRTTYALAHPMMSTAVAVVGPLVGWLAERRGPRAVLLVGGILMGAALFAAGRMETSIELYAIAVAVGVAVACLGDLPTAAAISTRFRARRGTALGLVYIGSNIGGSLGVLAGARLAAAGSWRSAFTAIAVGLWMIVLPCALAVGKPRRGGSPGETGPDSERESAGQGNGRAAQPRPGGSPEAEVAPPVGVGSALRTRDFWLLFWALFAFYFYRLGLNTHLVALLSDLGYSERAAAVGFGTTLAIGIVGKLFAGAIADRVGARTAVVGNFLLLFVASCLLLSPEGALTLPTFLVVHGISTAAEDVVVPLLIAARFGAIHLARIYGLLLLALVPGGYVGPVVAGRVFDVTGSYDGVFAVFVGSNLTALAAIWLVASSRRQATGLADGSADR
jgi:MFS family permease